jgi:outer membrane receptor protein involved in Fe transport
MRYCLLSCALAIVAAPLLMAGTTGKIAGKVSDQSTNEPLVGISVIVDGTLMGASTNIDGNYVILNVPPGTHSMVASGVGFQKRRFVNVKVSLDFTTRLDIKMSTDVISLETIEVEAEAPMVRKDLTSSQTSVDASVIASLPVENVTQVLSLQAGIVQGTDGEIHIRGGRSTEVSYTVNGVSMSNPYDNSKSVQIATNAIQELSVVSGTFNAEYGNALSGIVNTVTKEGGSAYRASFSFYTGDKLSDRSTLFLNVGDFQPLQHVVAEGTVGGPIPGTNDALTFFVSGRYDRDKGWLYGKREHNTTDSVYKNPLNPNDIVVVSTGDGSLVPMNPSTDWSATGKLAWALTPTMKLRGDIIYSNSSYGVYDHDLKYNPDAGLNYYTWGVLTSLELRHAIGVATFYTLRASYALNDDQNYLYPLVNASGAAVDYHAGMTLDTSYHADMRYQPDYKLSVRAAPYTFAAGGTINDQYYQRSEVVSGKFDITSQITTNHELKSGAELRASTLWYEDFTILRNKDITVPTIPSTSTGYHDSYVRYPTEFSVYAQDKMEFQSIILNVGVRYDYFAAKSKYAPDMNYPSPNSPTLPPQIDPSTLLQDAPAKHELSPRIGVSFPITDKGIIHFSYGHFIQMPPFSNLYVNPDFKYNFRTGTPTFGNANLNPERTITYEIGLQQQLLENLAFNVTGFYKDVRDLLALQQIRISTSETYYKYVNKDYANIKGVTFTLTKRRTASDLVGITIDYTFQVAEGNDVSTDAFFLDLSSGRQSEKVPVSLSWDQTHTLNATVMVGRSDDWNISLVGRLGSGLPYTPQDPERTIYLTPNSERKPAQMTVNLMADKTFALGAVNLTAFLKVYNLFDTANERVVYNDTGRATYTLVSTKTTAQQTDQLALTVPGVHPTSDYFAVPTYYTPPREVRVGVSLDF